MTDTIFTIVDGATNNRDVIPMVELLWPKWDNVTKSELLSWAENRWQDITGEQYWNVTGFLPFTLPSQEAIDKTGQLSKLIEYLWKKLEESNERQQPVEYSWALLLNLVKAYEQAMEMGKTFVLKPEARDRLYADILGTTFKRVNKKRPRLYNDKASKSFEELTSKKSRK